MESEFINSLEVLSKKLSCSGFQLLAFSLLPVFHPVLVAVGESFVFFNNSLKLLKSIHAGLVSFDVFWDMIFPESIQDFKFVIVFNVEVLTHLSLVHIQLRITIAILRDVLLNLFHS
mgnify:CR=1 FL=1